MKTFREIYGNLPLPCEQIKSIAVDADGCLFENRYPDLGEPNIELMKYLRYHQETGCKIILWTCRTNEHLFEVLHNCNKHGLIFDAVNDNPYSKYRHLGFSRKIDADLYLDDKALQVIFRGGNGQ